jgi:hypothetical protein
MSKSAWVVETRAECSNHNSVSVHLCFVLCETHAEALAQGVRAIADGHPDCMLVVREALATAIDPELVCEAAREMGEAE